MQLIIDESSLGGRTLWQRLSEVVVAVIILPDSDVFRFKGQYFRRNYVDNR